MSVSETHELNVPLSDTLIFVSNPKVVPFYFSSAASSCSSATSSKSVKPAATSRLYQEISFLISEECTRSRSKFGNTSAR